ncbi:vegetative cell wall protein gp1-like [Cervus elaphus]|uniref:vegetative cell wall protein gp1-like n=1 Tax=Cervus canadensis TaxID=1574408 RepID=UPI001CA386F2|nr:vegetative cell wall protein gp1-like [Cervus canadensis]XP_043733190.1 vegetative cell wall protein gp1-like [Cervus elaphus]
MAVSRPGQPVARGRLPKGTRASVRGHSGSDQSPAILACALHRGPFPSRPVGEKTLCLPGSCPQHQPGDHLGLEPSTATASRLSSLGQTKTADTQEPGPADPPGVLEAASSGSLLPGDTRPWAAPRHQLLEPRAASAPHPTGPQTPSFPACPRVQPLLTARHVPSRSPRRQPPSLRALLPAGDQPRSGLSSASCGPPTLHSKPTVPHRTPSQAGSLPSPRPPALTPPLSNCPLPQRA